MMFHTFLVVCFVLVLEHFGFRRCCTCVIVAYAVFCAQLGQVLLRLPFWYGVQSLGFVVFKHCRYLLVIFVGQVFVEPDDGSLEFFFQGSLMLFPLLAMVGSNPVYVCLLSMHPIHAQLFPRHPI